MNGNEWLSYIRKRKPRYAMSRVKLIERFANKGARKSDFVQFGPIYQLYEYAFILGFHRKLRIPLPASSSDKSDFAPFEKWNDKGIVNYILMLLLSHSPTIEEIDLDFRIMEHENDEEVKEKFNKLINILEEYANGGFSLIQEKFDSNPYFFNDSFAFTILLREISEGKLLN